MLYRFGDCNIDTGRRELWRAGQRIAVEPQVLAVLIHLIENRDRVVSRDEIQRRVWGDRLVSDSALSVRVKMARAAVGDDGSTQAVIRTAQRTGYRFVADVEACGSICLADGAHALPTAGAEAAPMPFSDKPSIVVLPFQAIGDLSQAEIIAQGLTSDVTTGIGRSGALFVIARGTASQFGGASDVREVGRKLGVRYVVHGSVQATRQRLRASVTLTEAESRHELWSERYDEPVEDAMRVQQQIADLLVGSLQAAVEREEQKRSLLLPSANLDAWTAYHRGAAFMFRFRADECAHAEHFFRRSIELDPLAPRAYAGLSFVHYQRVYMGMSHDRDDDALRARDLALQGVAADAFDPMAHWALGRASLLRGEFEAATQEFGRAVALNPSYAGAHYSLGWAYMLSGERTLSHECIELAKRLSPFDPLVFAMQCIGAVNLALGGRTGEAAALAEAAVLHPNAHVHVFFAAAVVYTLDGQRERGRALMARVRAIAPGYDLADYLRVMQFRSPGDLEQLRKAFAVLRA